MSARIITGDCREVLRTLPAESVHCVVTSPPYWGLRDYGVAGQIGLEENLHEHVELITAVFRDVRRVLRGDGTVWLNYGDAYANDGKWGGESNGKHAYLDDASRRRNGREKRRTGLKAKDRMLLPARVAIALQEDGWWVRDEIVWHKPNPMPSSVADRTTPAHEMIYLLSKSARYYYDNAAIREPFAESSVQRLSQKSIGQQAGGDKQDMYDAAGLISRVPAGGTLAAAGIRQFSTTNPRRAATLPRKFGENRGRPGSHLGASVPWEGTTRNRRSVWTIPSEPFPEAHFATFPPALIEPCILAGCPWGGLVLDPFGGAGTTGLVADRLGRDAILIELNPAYAEMARRRIHGDAPLFAGVEMRAAE